MGAVGGIGAKLLCKMGWSEGTGLGAKRDGKVEPLGAPKREENLGLGAERRPFQDTWWETLMEDAYGKAASSNGAEDNLLNACEGRRCRPHGTAKLARLEAHDRKAAKVTESKSQTERRKRKKDKLQPKDGGVTKRKRKKEKKERKKRKKEKLGGS